MTAKYALKKSTNGKFYFILHAANGQPILNSEMYESKDGAKTGIASVRANSPHDAQYERKNPGVNRYMFNLKATNGQVIGTSESYVTAAGRDGGIASVKANGPSAPIEDLL